MTRSGLVVKRGGPQLALQDEGRAGYLSFGVSRGGAMDPLAIAEARFLAGAEKGPVIEIDPGGARFECVGGDLVVSLTGAAMRASVNGRLLDWNAAHAVFEGDVIEIAASHGGGYGYVCLGGGIDAGVLLGSASAHFAAGIGGALTPGQRLDANAGGGAREGYRLRPKDPVDNDDPIRVLPSVQDHLFSVEEKSRFAATHFTKSHRGNRVGVALEFDGDGFRSRSHLSITSDVVVPGDVQLVGDGQPYVLFGECQTMGGYPRIATVISADLPRLAQMAPGQTLSFRYVDHEEALAARRDLQSRFEGLADRLEALHRDPRDVADLLSYQLVSGAISGDEE